MLYYYQARDSSITWAIGEVDRTLLCGYNLLAFRSEPGVKDPCNCGTPTAPLNHPTLSFTYCSTVGLSFVSARLKSSTVPTLAMLNPGKPELRRYINVPQFEQKWFVIVFPVAIVAF